MPQGGGGGGMDRAAALLSLSVGAGSRSSALAPLLEPQGRHASGRRDGWRELILHAWVQDDACLRRLWSIVVF